MTAPSPGTTPASNASAVCLPDGLTLTFDQMREHLTAAIVCDALDQIDLRRQSPAVTLPSITVDRILVGRCKTTLWADMSHEDPNPYELELAAVDSCASDDVMIAAAGGSMRSGIWGELLTTAALNRGCVGAIIHGAVRDARRMSQMDFPIYAAGTCLYDSQHRQRVIDIDVPVEIGGVLFSPGDLVLADRDGIVVVPKAQEAEVLARAWKKLHEENAVRDAIKKGMLATQAYQTFGVL